MNRSIFIYKQLQIIVEIYHVLLLASIVFFYPVIGDANGLLLNSREKIMRIVKISQIDQGTL